MFGNSFAQWLAFIRLVLKNGSIFIKPYDYSQHLHQLWSDNLEAKRLNIHPETPRRSFKYYLLFLPFIGPAIALISLYRLQKKWPVHVYHWPEKKLAYARISKNAGTAVQAAILEKQYPDLNLERLTVNQINEMGKKFIKPYLEPGYECFTLVRNPYDRLLSCYFDQIVGREKRFYFDDYAFRVLKKGMSFENFVNAIKDIPNTIKDIHFNPQYYYTSKLKCIKCFRIEKDNELLKEYLQKFGLELTTYNRNETKFRKEEYYSPIIKEMVFEIYKDDFEKLGYSANEL